MLTPIAPPNLWPITTITANTTLTAAHATVLCNNSTDITVTLPAAASCAGRLYRIKKIGANTNLVTIDGNGSETIDGATTLVLYVQFDHVEIASDGSNWHVVGGYLAPHECHMRRSTAQSIDHNTDTDIALDDTDYDNAGLADEVNGRITIKRAGSYIPFAHAAMFNESSQILIRIKVNGSSVARNSHDGGDTSPPHEAIAAWPLRLAAGDHVTMSIQHTQGGSLNTLTTTAAAPKLALVEQR